MLTFSPSLIGSAFIEHETSSWVWLKIFCGTYTNHTYVFDFHVRLWKVVYRVSVGCSDLFASIYWFALSEISFKFFVQAFFVDFWLLYIICIGSDFIDPETCPCMWLQIVIGPYTNQTNWFYPLADLCKVVASRHQNIDWLQGGYSCFVVNWYIYKSRKFDTFVGFICL